MLRRLGGAAVARPHDGLLAGADDDHLARRRGTSPRPRACRRPRCPLPSLLMVNVPSVVLATASLPAALISKVCRLPGRTAAVAIPFSEQHAGQRAGQLLHRHLGGRTPWCTSTASPHAARREPHPWCAPASEGRRAHAAASRPPRCRPSRRTSTVPGHLAELHLHRHRLLGRMSPRRERAAARRAGGGRRRRLLEEQEVPQRQGREDQDEPEDEGRLALGGGRCQPFSAQAIAQPARRLTPSSATR